MSQLRRAAPYLVIALALVAGLPLLLRSCHAEDDLKVVRDFYVDEQTMAFERHATGEYPPLVGHRGHGVVIAKCFQGDDGLVIGWLVRYPAEIQAQLDAARDAGNLPPDLLISASQAAEVRSPESGSTWIPRASPAGQALCVPPKRKDGSDAVPAQPVE
jgi:hypothetical protein